MYAIQNSKNLLKNKTKFRYLLSSLNIKFEIENCQIFKVNTTLYTVLKNYFISWEKLNATLLPPLFLIIQVYISRL